MVEYVEYIIVFYSLSFNCKEKSPLPYTDEVLCTWVGQLSETRGA